jgi:hypothetical protein
MFMIYVARFALLRHKPIARNTSRDEDNEHAARQPAQLNMTTEATSQVLSTSNHMKPDGLSKQMYDRL